MIAGAGGAMRAIGWRATALRFQQLRLDRGFRCPLSRARGRRRALSGVQAPAGAANSWPGCRRFLFAGMAAGSGGTGSASRGGEQQHHRQGTAAAFFVRFPARARRSRALGGAGAGRRGEFLAGLPAISFCWNGRGVGRYGVRFARRGAATSPAGDRGRLLCAFSRAREAEPGALGGAGAGRRGEFLAGLPAISFCWNGRGVGRYGVRFARRGAATSPAGDRGRLLCAFSRAREAEPGALGGAGAGRRGEFLAGLPAISFCWNGRGVGRYGVRFARRGAATSPAGRTATAFFVRFPARARRSRAGVQGPAGAANNSKTRRLPVNRPCSSFYSPLKNLSPWR